MSCTLVLNFFLYYGLKLYKPGWFFFSVVLRWKWIANRKPKTNLRSWHSIFFERRVSVFFCYMKGRVIISTFQNVNLKKKSCLRYWNPDTVNLWVSVQGAYFKFRRRRDVLIQGGCLFNFPQIVAWHDHFSDTLSAHEHQRKLFIDIKSWS